MKLKLFSVLALSGLIAAGVACGDTDTDDDGEGGEGGSGGQTGTTKTTSTKATGTQTVTTGNGTTATGTPGCDDGTPGDINSQACTDCTDCAFDGECADELAAFQADPNAQVWFECVFGDANMMGGCPEDDPNTPADEFDECFADCGAASPGVEDLYIGALSCAICGECPTNCDAATNCM